MIFFVGVVLLLRSEEEGKEEKKIHPRAAESDLGVLYRGEGVGV